MKKSILALAVLSAFAAGAQAQSSVTMYGLLDAGVVAERSCDGCNVTKVSSGVASGSRLGFRGSEGLGSGMAAIFVLEAGILADTGRSDQGGVLFGRQAFVGLNGNFGAVTVGRQYNLEYLALTDVADPFKGGMAGTATNLVGYSAKRMDNTIQYASPDMNGFTLAAAYGFGETAGSTAANRAYGAALGYANGPLTLRLAHQNKNTSTVAGTTALASSTNAKNTILAGNMNFGVATAYAAYGINKGEGSSPFWNADNPYGAAVPATSSTDSRDALLGVSVPFGATTLMASYIHKDDKNPANRDARQIAVGATYAMSKRTDVYAAYSHIKNRNGAAYTVGNATEAGTGCIAFNVGMRHTF
jgi:predicted porin